MKFQKIIFIAILMFFAASLNAQVAPIESQTQTDYEEGVYLFKTENGYLYVFNFEKDAYQIELKGDKLKYLDEHIPLAFSIDNKFINLLFVLNKNYWKINPNAKNDPTENELLDVHKIWESDYLSGRYKTKLSVSSEIFNLESGRKVIYWSFPVPKQLDLDFSHQNFLTTLVGKNIVGISGAPTNSAEEKTFRSYLIETMNTLKISDKPFNIKELRLLHQELNFGEDSL